MKKQTIGVAALAVIITSLTWIGFYPVHKSTSTADPRTTQEVMDEMETLIQSIDSSIMAGVRQDQWLLQAVPFSGVTMTVHPVDFSLSPRGIVRVDCKVETKK